MEFGVFHEFQCRAGQPHAEAFRLALEQVDALERWGLDVLWLAELHVAPDRSVISAPLNVASAIAARTRRMRIGIAVQVLPLCHPLRLAEEAATVDQLSGGRLIFGAGRSGFQSTYEAYGIPYAESRERFAEALAIVKLAWTRERFSYAGRFHSFADVCLMPKPLQRPHPPIRIAATSPDSFPAIGALGHPIFCAVRLGTLSELGPAIRDYRAAYAAAGHPGHGKVYLRVPVYLAETEARARAEPEASIMAFYRYLGARIEESAGKDGARALERRAERGRRLGSVGYDEALRDKVIVGTPAQVTGRLRELRDELGLDGILAEPNCGGAIAHDAVLRSLRLLCEEVQPRFRSAEIGIHNARGTA